MTWYTRYTFQAIEKMQRENIKAFEPKLQRVKDLYNHTHELMKRLVWSARKQTPYISSSSHLPFQPQRNRHGSPKLTAMST
jgi:hypothetical protein